MGAQSKSTGGEQGKPARKQWRPPELRKLPIAATASGKGFGNEGGCVGKGDGGICRS